MAEFEFDGGGKSASLKKLFKNKKFLLAAGGVVLLAAFFMMKRSQQANDSYLIAEGYASNDVATQEALANASSIMQGSVDQALSQFSSQQDALLNQYRQDVFGSVNDWFSDQKGLMDDNLSDMASKYADAFQKQQEYIDSLNEQFKQWQKEQTDLSKQTPEVVKPKGVTFGTQAYGSLASAQKALAEVQRVAGPNVQIRQEGNTYRVVGTSSNINGANSIINHLNKSGLSSGGYSNGSYVAPTPKKSSGGSSGGGSSSSPTPSKSSGGYQFATGTMSYASAQKALSVAQQSLGKNVSIKQEGNSYRIVGSSSNQVAANNAINTLKDKGVTGVGYVTKK